MDFSKQKLFKVLRWYGTNSALFEEGVSDPASDVEEVTDFDTADIVSSERAESYGPKRHIVMFDVDIPMEVIESSTPGHYHVYFPETHISKIALLDLLEELSSAGIVEPGYVGASRARGFAALRLPWVHKDGSRDESNL